MNLKQFFFGLFFLTSLVSSAQIKSKEVLFTIDDKSYYTDEFERIYKKNLDLEMLDPTGVVVEKWIMQGCLITGADFGALSYASDALAEISVTIQPDRCILVY